MDNKLVNTHRAVLTAQELMATGRGIIAMDESIETCNTRFAMYGIPQTAEKRREWRELIVTTPYLGQYLSGAILFDETIRQTLKNGDPFVEVLESQGIVPGIKVDKGTVNIPFFPGEKITEGMDGLRERLEEYERMRLRFAKWRAVIYMGKDRPSPQVINTNASLLARFAALCQEVGLTPIVEPEVITSGEHTLEQCLETTEWVQKALFTHLYKHRVTLEGIILKPNMVLPGDSSPDRDAVETIAGATVNCLLRSVPAAVPGIAFLSGGQEDRLASARLNEINLHYADRLPWPVTFSYSRALQSTAMGIWKGQDANKTAAQAALAKRAGFNSDARLGIYSLVEEG